MFAIHVELMTGRYVATAHDDRRRAEWPPHPARLFSALVAAHYEGTPTAEERAALVWLEQQPAPSLSVSNEPGAVGHRDVHDVFVPVNDITTISSFEHKLRESLTALEKLRGEGADPKVIKKAEKEVTKRRAQLATELSTPDHDPPLKTLNLARALLPGARTRQMRTFPVVVPEDPNIVFLWASTPTSAVRACLQSLCERVTRLGHSSSLVWCRVGEPVAPSLVARHDGDLLLRTVAAGQLDRLDAAFAEHQGIQGRVLPAVPQRYGPPLSERPSVRSSLFADDWIVFERVGGARIQSSRTADLARALRGALLERHGQPGMPAALSGHEADGRPTTQPHLAFVALPYVGSEHADGSVKGMAIVPPRLFTRSDQVLLYRLIAQWEQAQPDGCLTLAGKGLPPVVFKRVEVASLESSRPRRWSRQSNRFVTATPIALDRNPGNLRSNFERTAHKAAEDAEATIADSCEAIGLPRPSNVEISFAPLLQGAQAATAFLAARPGKPQRVRVHAEIKFAENVCGPVLIGAGRHFGLGLCLPMGEGA